jgi:hypothetical protein
LISMEKRQPPKAKALSLSLFLSLSWPPQTKRQHPPPYIRPQPQFLSTVPTIASANFWLVVVFF